MATNKNNTPKPIIETTIDGKFLRYFGQGKFAALEYNFNPAFITLCLQKRIKHARGHYFRLATPDEIQNATMITQKLEQQANTAPVILEPEIIIPDIPAETISADIKRPTEDEEGLTPMEILIKRRKK